MDRRSFLKIAGFGGISVALFGSYPFLIEKNLVLVNHYRIPVPSLPESFHWFRIAHLTDLHFGPLVSGSFLEGVIEKTNKLRPDMIVCKGDYAHEKNSKKEVNAVWSILSRLSARFGVYSVLGNHDHYADTNLSLEWLHRSGQDIRHTSRAIYKGKDRVIIGGAGDYWEDDLKIDQCFSSSDEGDCRILLTHNPDSVDTDFTTPVSLIISGHTHGGQVSIPFYGPPIVPVKNKRYTSGLIETEKGKLFISKGIGCAIYPLRFNCAPEIAVLELAVA